jgi:histidinol-phosphatase
MSEDPVARLAEGLAAAPSGWGSEWSASLRRGSEAELRGWVEAALRWCDETDAIAMAHFRRELAEAFPDHGVVGEEYGIDAAGASVRWLVDPIDATHNFMRGVPLFATLMAVERDGELQAAVISAPALGERWWAWRGGGAWSAGRADGAPRRIAVSRIADVADAQVLYSSGTDLERSGRAPGFRDLAAAAWRERGFGDFWGYTLVAEGAAEAMLEVGLSVWDAAAPMVIVEEAGGRVTDFDGRRAPGGPSFLATNGLLHDEIRARLAAAPGGASRGSPP